MKRSFTSDLKLKSAALPQVKNFKSEVEVLDFFKDESTCRAYLEQQRWGGNICCPHCRFMKVYRTDRGFKCAGCKKKFSVLVKTVFENTKIKLRYWFAAIYMITSSKKGVSSYHMADTLGITQRTAWYLNHRIRKMLDAKFESSNLKLSGVVMADETFIGGKRKNMHYSKRLELRKNYGAGGTGEKHIVFGMLQEGGHLIMMPVKNRESYVLQPIIEKYVEPGSIVVTDTHGGYVELEPTYLHVQVNHSIGNYVSPEKFHTNSIESAWGILKRGYIGVYHYMSAKHLHRYCAEFSYRFNSRYMSNAERFNDALLNLSGRLRYKDVVAAA